MPYLGLCFFSLATNSFKICCIILVLKATGSQVIHKLEMTVPCWQKTLDEFPFITAVG